MGIIVHICIQNVPPYLMGGFMGAMPPESTFAPPYMQRPTRLLSFCHLLIIDCYSVISPMSRRPPNICDDTRAPSKEVLLLSNSTAAAASNVVDTNAYLLRLHPHVMAMTHHYHNLVNLLIMMTTHQLLQLLEVVQDIRDRI